MRTVGLSTVILLAVLSAPVASGQILRGPLPGRSLGAQYAGSIGLVSVTGMRHARNEKLAVGLGFGHTPLSHGGPLYTWSGRFMYTPWRVALNDRLRLEPLQVGLFVAYTAGLDLQGSWPSHLDRGYYWWSPNFRQHLHVRSQLSWSLAPASPQRLAVYFEVNTNDLYVYSWWPNRSSITVGDILFFGAGVQYYFRPYTPKPPG